MLEGLYVSHEGKDGLYVYEKPDTPNVQGASISNVNGSEEFE